MQHLQNLKVRESHREKTINDAGIKEELQELSKKQKADYNKAWQKKNRKTKIKESEEAPKIKGSKTENKKEKSNAYLTFDEQKQFLRILMQRGLTFEESKERINNLREEQKRVRGIMREKNKSEDEIKQKQQEMLEDLWRD